MGADGKNVAQQPVARPTGDALIAVVMAEHVAKLDVQLLLGGGVEHALPARLVVPGRLVQQQVTAGRDHGLGLRQIL